MRTDCLKDAADVHGEVKRREIYVTSQAELVIRLQADPDSKNDLKVWDVVRNGSDHDIIQSLVTVSETIQYPILAPSTQEITNEDDAYLRELFYENKEVFKQLSLQDHKTSLEVVHRGLGDDRGNKHPSFYKKRKLLADRSEKVRRQNTIRRY